MLLCRCVLRCLWSLGHSRLVLFLLLAVFLTASVASAQPQLGGKVVAVQARKYKLKHEIHLAGGYLPLDAFFKGLTVGGDYTFHFNDFIAWEVGNFLLSNNVATSLRQDLEQNFGVTTTEFNELRYLLTSSVVVKPVYKKMILFNRMLVHGETSFVLGGGIANFDDGAIPTVGVGMILRAWLSRAWSVRADVRHHLGFDGFSNIENVFYVGLGISLSYPWK